MKKRGFTLVEVIVAIFLISLLAITFLPMITFGFKETIAAAKFTDAMFADQEMVENEIENIRETDPPVDSKIKVYGLDIRGHNISVATTSSGEINAFIPKNRVSVRVPVISSPPVLDVRKNDIRVTPRPTEFNLLDNTFSLFVDEITIENSTKDVYLMSVYRWYMSPEMDISLNPTKDPNQYFILKEWNAAKKPLSYSASSNLKFIPNIKENYNIVKFVDAKTNLNLSDEDYITTLGNRFIMYGVTPFSVIGKIGKEEVSNYVYIRAPRIEIIDAHFESNNEDANRIFINFKDDISDVVNPDNINLNSSIGVIVSAYRDDNDHKRLIIEVEDFDSSIGLDGNKLSTGAVESAVYGKISIWHNNIVNGEFSITP